MDAPRWVGLAGIAASLVYPALKISWALGSAWVAPPDTVGVVDATFVVTTAIALAGTPPLVIVAVLRSTPDWSRAVALLGGMILAAIGATGLWSVRIGTEELATGLLVYGGWLVWGLCIIAVSRGLGSRTEPGHDTSPTS